ncbi:MULTISPECIES: winged helix-turn-helix transcriptional regulator [Bifidobacterium]|uniref:winged helix-turn-helix transcriptional regulator n=1 Tax=Bifidobacterium TaxID=1678 RepID=UPI001BDC4B29|nr:MULTISPECIES: winged helix-turn-helix transcriptional regulator [Bifidobacterium]MBT1161668.1 helix-turn-helix transcriptional regulator [Bifidobacterium sp. SO1]MBW3078717.1 helix-turn-helix transcriptional regulator [Bifidobacterium simiiventris]
MAGRHNVNIDEHHYFDLFEAVSGKWSVLVIELLRARPLTFKEICERLRSMPESEARNTLTRLQRAGVVAIRANSCMRTNAQYMLTDVGKSALPHVAALHLWAKANYEYAVIYADAARCAQRYILIHRQVIGYEEQPDADTLEREETEEQCDSSANQECADAEE